MMQTQNESAEPNSNVQEEPQPRTNSNTNSSGGAPKTEKVSSIHPTTPPKAKPSDSTEKPAVGGRSSTKESENKQADEWYEAALSQAAVFVKDTVRRREEAKIPLSSTTSSTPEKANVTTGEVDGTANYASNLDSLAQAITTKPMIDDTQTSLSVAKPVGTAENCKLGGKINGGGTVTNAQTKDDSENSEQESRIETHNENGVIIQEKVDDTGKSTVELNIESNVNDAMAQSSNSVLETLESTKKTSVVAKLGDVESLDLTEMQEQDKELALLEVKPPHTILDNSDIKTPTSSIKKQPEKSKSSSSALKKQAQVQSNKTVHEILANARKLKNFKEEKIPQGLPEGWIEHIHVRPNSQNRGNRGSHRDHYWFTPKTGKKLRSKPEIQRFLKYLQIHDGDEEVAYNKLKGLKVKVVSSKSTKSNTSKGRKASIKQKTQTKQAKTALKKTQKQSASASRKRDTTPEKVTPTRQRKRVKKNSSVSTSVGKTKRKIIETKVSSKPVHQARRVGAKSQIIAESKTAKGTGTTQESKKICNALLVAEAKAPVHRTKITAKKASSSNPFKTVGMTKSKTPQVAQSKS